MSMDTRINKRVERDVALESKRKEHLLLHRRSSRATMRACYRAPLALPSLPPSLLSPLPPAIAQDPALPACLLAMPVVFRHAPGLMFFL